MNTVLSLMVVIIGLSCTEDEQIKEVVSEKATGSFSKTKALRLSPENIDQLNKFQQEPLILTEEENKNFIQNINIDYQDSTNKNEFFLCFSPPKEHKFYNLRNKDGFVFLALLEDLGFLAIITITTKNPITVDCDEQKLSLIRGGRIGRKASVGKERLGTPPPGGGNERESRRPDSDRIFRKKPPPEWHKYKQDQKMDKYIAEPLSIESKVKKILNTLQLEFPLKSTQ